MPRAITLFLTLALTGCISKSTSFELYASIPVDVDCVPGAIEATDGIRGVTQHNSSLEFDGFGFSGRILYGDDSAPFTIYVIEIESKAVFADAPELITEKIADSIYTYCAKPGVE